MPRFRVRACEVRRRVANRRRRDRVRERVREKLPRNRARVRRGGRQRVQRAHERVRDVAPRRSGAVREGGEPTTDSRELGVAPLERGRADARRDGFRDRVRREAARVGDEGWRRRKRGDEARSENAEEEDGNGVVVRWDGTRSERRRLTVRSNKHRRCRESLRGVEPRRTSAEAPRPSAPRDGGYSPRARARRASAPPGTRPPRPRPPSRGRMCGRRERTAFSDADRNFNLFHATRHSSL